MWLVALAGFIAIALLVAYFLARTLGRSTTPAYVHILAFVAFFMPVSIALLLPIDIVSGLSDTNASSGPLLYMSRTWLLKIWRLYYWLCFVLTLSVLPITQSYELSGYRQSSAKLLQSCRRNLRLQLIYLSIGIVAILYVVANSQLRSFRDLKAFVIALANTWGLFVALSFMGHAFVDVPRQLWHAANHTEHIKRNMNRADVLWNAFQTAKATELNLARDVLYQIEQSTVPSDWSEELIAAFPLLVIDEAKLKKRTQESTWFSLNVFSRPKKLPNTEATMATLSAQVRQAVEDKRRYEIEWDYLVKKTANLFQLERMTMQGEDIKDKFQYILYAWIIPLAQRLLAIVVGLIALSIVWSEIMIGYSDKIWRPIDVPIHAGQVGLCSTLILLFMYACCLSSLLRLNIYKRYTILDNGHTSANSILFYANYACRITVPLAYK